MEASVAKVLSSQTMEVVALEVASGIPLGQIGRAHDLTPKELTRVLEDPEVEARIKDKKKVLELSNQLVLSKLALNAPAIAENIISVAMDSTHPKFLQAAMWALDKRIPQVQRIEQDIHHHIDAELSATVLHGIQELRAVRPPEREVHSLEDDPHLKDGAEVMADRERAQSTPSGQRPSGGNGRAQD